MRRNPRMDTRELRDCIEGSFGPRPTQHRGLTFHLMAFSWPGGAADHSDPRRGPRFWSDQAVLPLPACTCASGLCRLCT